MTGGIWQGTLQDTVRTRGVPGVDLDVDSDNDGALMRSMLEDREEDAGVANGSTTPTKPGLIVPVGGSRAQMIVDVPAGRTASLAITQGADKVRLWPAPTGGTAIAATGTTIVGGSAQTFWIEAFAASATMADIAFTLTLHDNPGSGSTGSAPSDTIRATAVAVDLDVDELPDDREDIGAGAIVWRNSDFSRLLPHPDPAKRDAEPGLRRYAPDYSDSRAIDPEHATQLCAHTTATLVVPDSLGRWIFSIGNGGMAWRGVWIGTSWPRGADGWRDMRRAA